MSCVDYSDALFEVMKVAKISWDLCEGKPQIEDKTVADMTDHNKQHSDISKRATYCSVGHMTQLLFDGKCCYKRLL